MKIENLVKEVYLSLEKNNFGTLGEPNEHLFEEPLIGVAAGDDEYFDFLKTHIDEFHWTPAEAFALKYAGPVDAADLRVISMVFPQNDISKTEQDEVVLCQDFGQLFLKKSSIQHYLCSIVL